MTSPRIVVITGATSGLGRALAQLHLAKGDVVIAASRSAAGLDERTAMTGQQTNMHPYSLDVGDPDAVVHFAAWVQERFGRCDFLYNNAGTAVFKPLVQMETAELDSTLQTNIAGVIHTTRAFLPMMLAARCGRIINIASLAGRVATAKASVYAASKAAVLRFSEGLRQELAGTGIFVTCALPGPIDTPFLDRADQTGEYRNKVQNHLLTPEQTAEKICRAAEKKRPEVALPKTLAILSVLYTLFPHRLKQLISPLINRK